MGAEYFQSRGYRIFAMVDNEPENLEPLPDISGDRRRCFSHATPISKSKANPEHLRLFRGASYEPDEFSTAFTLDLSYKKTPREPKPSVPARTVPS